MLRQLKFFYGNSNPELAKDICNVLNIHPGKLRTYSFSNGNIKVKIEENIRNDDVVVLQTSSEPTNDHLV
mgnify:CR=1 FL=1